MCKCDLCRYMDPPDDEIEVLDDDSDDEDEGPSDREIERAQDRFEQKVYGDKE